MKALVADSLNEKGIEKLQKVCDVVVDTNMTLFLSEAELR